MIRLTPVLTAAVLLLVTAALGLAQSAAVKEDYYKRLAKLSPRDAQAHYALSSWCEEQGLAEQARGLLERCIRIDPDHAAARSTLGYTRHGLTWRLGGGPAPEIAGDDPSDASSPDAEGTTDGGGAEPATPGDAAPTGDGGTAEVEKVDRLASKRAFFEKARAEFGKEFNTKEDKDFLVHTTSDINSPEMKKLLSLLKSTKRAIQAHLGSPPSGGFWPDKVQIILLRSAVECVQFAEHLDGQRFPERDAFYTREGHTVLYLPDGQAGVARTLARDAFDTLTRSDRSVNWWLPAGFETYIASQMNPEGDARLWASIPVASVISDSPQDADISKIVDVPGDIRNISDGDRLNALTVVEFFAALSKRKIKTLLDGFNEDDAPAAPSDPIDQVAARQHFIDYVGYQEKLLEKTFRMDYEKLDSRWKQYVIARLNALKLREAGGTGGTGGGSGDGGARRGRRGGGDRATGGSDRRGGDRRGGDRRGGGSDER